jgi:hypothetical protein
MRFSQLRKWIAFFRFSELPDSSNARDDRAGPRDLPSDYRGRIWAKLAVHQRTSLPTMLAAIKNESGEEPRFLAAMRF